MAGKKKKNSFRRRGPRLMMGWQNISSLAGNQSTDEDGTAGLAFGENLIPQSTTQLDFGRRRWIKLIRLILRIFLVLTPDGTQRQVRSVCGVRIAAVDNADALSGDQPGLLGTEANDVRVDWLFRDAFVTQVPASGDNVIVNATSGGPPVWDFKPGRRIGPQEALVFHHHHVLLATDSTNFDGAIVARLEGRILWGSPN